MSLDETENSMDSLSVGQTQSLLRNPKVHYHVHMSRQLDPILSQVNPFHILICYFFKILFNIILQSVTRSPNRYKEVGRIL
jgi:hypothetical protein